MFGRYTFLKDILIAWRNITAQEFEETGSRTPIWNNSSIRSENKPFFYKTWFQRSIKYLGDIYDFRTNTYYSVESMNFLYNIPNFDYLKYLTLIKSIPQNIKVSVDQNLSTTAQSRLLEQILNCQKPNKILYKYQFKNSNIDSKLNNKWGKYFDVNHINWKQIFKLQFETTIDNNFKNVQYMYLMRFILIVSYKLRTVRCL